MMRTLVRIVLAPVRLVGAVLGLVVGGVLALVGLTLALIRLPIRVVGAVVGIAVRLVVTVARLALAIVALPFRVVGAVVGLALRGAGALIGAVWSVLGRTLVIAAGVTAGFALGYALLRGVRSVVDEGVKPEQE